MSTDTERRDVASLDPSLSAEANAMITRELRAVVGSDSVDVAGADPRNRERSNARHRPLVAGMFDLRVELVVGVLALAVCAVLAVVAQDSGWFVLLPLAALVVALSLVVRMIVRVSMEIEHVSPELAARLESEGVAEPDRMFTEMLDDFVTVTAGDDERATESADDPAAAAAEQRKAITPTAHPSTPEG